MCAITAWPSAAFLGTKIYKSEELSDLRFILKMHTNNLEFILYLLCKHLGQDRGKDVIFSYVQWHSRPVLCVGPTGYLALDLGVAQ